MKERSLLIVLFLTIAATAMAQPYVSRLGRFQVDQRKMCAGYTITLTNLLSPGVECTPGKPCVMNYEGANIQQQFTYQYNTPGTYRLTVLYQSLGFDDITITVVPNIQPSFDIYACSGNGAQVKVQDSNYEQYVIDFNNDGTPEAVIPFSNNATANNTFAPPGTYTIAVKGRNVNSADNCNAKTQPFTSLGALPTPVINTLTSVDASSIKLDFTTAVNVLYRLEIATNNSTTFQILQNVYGINTVTIPGLKLDENFYCFRLTPYDPCIPGPALPSNIVCSDRFTATAISDSNQLAWVTSSTGVSNYTISRNNGAYFTTGAQTFNDIAPNIVCKTNYCYRITTNYSNGSKSISLEKCVKSFSTKIPTLINDVSALAGAVSGVDLTWTQDPAFIPQSYSVLKSVNRGTYDFLSSSGTTKFSDATYTTAANICYRINYIDVCDNNSPQGTPVCPIKLSGTLDKSNVITLHWTGFKGWKNGVNHYQLEKYSIQGTLIRTVTLTDSTFVDDQIDLNNQLVRYIVRAIPNDLALLPSVSNVVEFIKNANLYYPTAFTPNNDNLNDKFIVSGQYISKITLKIFDRWGSLLFATEKNEAWDGHREGKTMPPSTYVWQVEITDLAGRTFSREGIVALLAN
ncbi:MAG: T9SS type B sorting domain-containing protein [Cyclobacteriaceae bacterium]|nr:T9SS type B sorting domain-containing protein [Cyclobacteriaceae bacterium]